MPKPSLDTEAAIHAMIQVLNSEIPRETLSNNPQLLSEQIEAAQSFNWQKAADIMGLPKTKLYHWYRETFIRRLKQQLTPQDLDTLKDVVKAAVRSSKEITVAQIKPLLSQPYDNEIVYVAMQNTKKARELTKLIPLEPLPRYQLPVHKLLTASEIENKISDLVTPRTARSVIEEGNLEIPQSASLSWCNSDEDLEFSLF